ncbi:GntR family transcriptional regulator [Arthrobacter halodurans]|uniref:GntR family transcriptional regulator n=1 Tax=Arthrobacter halodurans TaxID=516699 RepID=A0ABV4UJV7_9MICC
MDNSAPAAPKYYRLKEELRGLVRDAEPGSPIPTERALASRYETSRTTVRQAIAELVAEGVLSRTQGKGTFVAPSSPTYVRQLTSFTDDAAAQDLRSSSRILGIEHVTADASLVSRFGMPMASELTRVERVRLINGEPLAHEAAYLPGVLDGLRGHLEGNGSLYATLSAHYGIDIAEAEDTVETMVAGPEDALLLKTEMGAPLLLIHRRGLDAEGTPVEWTRSVFRGDRFRFFARTRR